LADFCRRGSPPRRSSDFFRKGTTRPSGFDQG